VSTQPETSEPAANPEKAAEPPQDASSGELKSAEFAKAQQAVDRRADIDAKQSLIGNLLTEEKSDLFLIFDPANIAWLTSGAATRGLMSQDEQPLLCYSATQRWLVCGNFETQRMFDEELDGLGFMLKEWAWPAGRERVLTDLARGRAIASDRPLGNAKVVADPLRAARLILTPYEQACLRQLGKVVVHALEATGRSADVGDTERELAGQVAHRLMRYGATPVSVSVSGDGRSRAYRRHGFTGSPVNKYAVLAATARKYGLYVSAARTFHFGAADDKLKEEHVAACRVLATYTASSWPDAVPHDILLAGQRVYKLTNFEHEWELAPQGYIIGRAPVEASLSPTATDVFRTNCAVTWGPSIGAAMCQDTLLISERGPVNMTRTENWATATIKVAGEEFVCPYILER
jgi:hypothetical protein